ncbi:MAG: hypothetical protein NWR09_08690, partial [Pseudomonadales bacterium]|nr:hypothetical protein [Pseudomonadales bacterium]
EAPVAEAPVVDAAVVEAPVVEAPVVDAAPKAPRRSQTAAETVAQRHPSAWGRAANDPRENPGAAITGPVLSAVPDAAPAAVLAAQPRALDASHPSQRGRAGNDPRARRQVTATE